jgi:putative hydrolase of the HAD superfamily
MGVLYEVWDDMRQLLVPFVRARGCALSDEEIQRTYRRAMLGELATAQLWNELGVAGDARDLNQEYLRGYQLVPGIHALLDDLRQRGLELACISNDVAEWSLARRVALKLDRRIRYWTISSELHVRKPDVAIYEAFLASAALLPQEVMLVDDRVVNVEAAAALGFRTIFVDFAGVRNDARAPRTVEDLRRSLADQIGPI